jgi:hypothetical protein
MCHHLGDAQYACQLRHCTRVVAASNPHPNPAPLQTVDDTRSLLPHSVAAGDDSEKAACDSYGEKGQPRRLQARNFSRQLLLVLDFHTRVLAKVLKRANVQRSAVEGGALHAATGHCDTLRAVNGLGIAAAAAVAPLTR